MKQTIQQYLGVPPEWPVKEKIKHEIVLMPNKQDIKTADRQNPLGCALHNAACRVYGIPNAAIGGRWAYIPQRDSKGNYYIARMQATPATQAALREFDNTGTMPESGFRFVPITPSHRYKAKAAYGRARTQAATAPTKTAKRVHVKRITTTRTIPLSLRSK